jgi:hypothetical protein
LYRAGVAELADAHGSGPCTRKGVGVRVPSSAPTVKSNIDSREFKLLIGLDSSVYQRHFFGCRAPQSPLLPAFPAQNSITSITNPHFKV